MSHSFQISDEQYGRLVAYTEQYKQTPEQLFQQWVNEIIRKVDTLQSFRLKEQTEPEISEEDMRNHPLLRVAGVMDTSEP